ncbi:hypothetical protein [Jannaschia donghaensis]|uniref:Uncharacterized protein n=1 Tax=Jannaschia donghaensis TaxID=420998 RepID=A0A0M6YJX1_9RHOB|nr:hypothetical protein [Jannaschia donghaensis]CTQ50099.1 hypothetical protein JDO7802_02117 [Jannaschia donghaensis]
MKSIVCVDPAHSAPASADIAKFLYDEIFGASASFDHQYVMAGEMLAAFFERFGAAEYTDDTSVVGVRIGRAEFSRRIVAADTSRELSLIDIVDLLFAYFRQYGPRRKGETDPKKILRAIVPPRMVPVLQMIGLLNSDLGPDPSVLPILIKGGFIEGAGRRLVREGYTWPTDWVSDVATNILRRTREQSEIFAFEKEDGMAFMMVTEQSSHEDCARYRWRYGEYLPSPGTRPFVHPVDDPFLQYVGRKFRAELDGD